MQRQNSTDFKADFFIVAGMITMTAFWPIDMVMEMGWLWKISEKTEMFLDVAFLAAQIVMVFLVVGVLKRRRILEDERDKAVLKADQERARAESIIASIGDAVCILDREHRIIYQNDAHKALQGSHQGEYCYAAIHGRDLVCKDCGVMQTFSDAKVHRFENSSLREDGSLRHVEILSSPLFDEKGEVSAAIETVRDITDQRHVADQLQMQLAAIEAAIDGIAILTASGEYIYLNHAHAAIYGYDSPAELVGKSWRVLYTDKERERLESLLVEELSRHGGWRGEAFGLRRDGSKFPQEISITALSDVGMVCICRDTTRQKEMEVSLRESEMHLKAILDNIPDLAWLKDRQSRFLLVNEPMARACGRRPDELVGLGDQDVWPAEVAERYIADDMEIMESRCRKVVEEFIYHGDGSESVVETIKTPIVNSQGEVVGSTGIARDITGRKAEAELVNRLNQELHQRANDLIAANRELEAFSFSISHDLRNILTSMYLAVQELNDQYSSSLDETGQFFVKNLKDSCEKMEEFVEAMLVLSRVSRQEMTRSDVDLGELAKQIFSDLKAKEPNRDITFNATPSMNASCDPHLLRVALENLVGNAWKYTSKTAGARIEFGSREEGGERIFWIRDNGAGFSMKDAAKLFKPFKRLHLADEFDGSGIGLATVQRIILRHGGRIWGEGEPGKGAIFYFTLG